MGQNHSEFHILIDEAVNIQLKLNLFSWMSFFHLIFELNLDEAFHPICEHLTGPEVLLNLGACASSKRSYCSLDRLFCLRLTATCVTNIKQNTPCGLSCQP